MTNVPEVISGECMLRVYRLPEKLTNGYCFGGGVPITFINVDWFGGSPEPVKVQAVVQYIRNKRYYDPLARYLVLSDSFAFTIEPVQAPAEATRDPQSRS